MEKIIAMGRLILGIMLVVMGAKIRNSPFNIETANVGILTAQAVGSALAAFGSYQIFKVALSPLKPAHYRLRGRSYAILALFYMSFALDALNGVFSNMQFAPAWLIFSGLQFIASYYLVRFCYRQSRQNYADLNALQEQAKEVVDVFQIDMNVDDPDPEILQPYVEQLQFIQAQIEYAEQQRELKLQRKGMRVTEKAEQQRISFEAHCQYLLENPTASRTDVLSSFQKMSFEQLLDFLIFTKRPEYKSQAELFRKQANDQGFNCLITNSLMTQPIPQGKRHADKEALITHGKHLFTNEEVNSNQLFIDQALRKKIYNFKRRVVQCAEKAVLQIRGEQSSNNNNEVTEHFNSPVQSITKHHLKRKNNINKQPEEIAQSQYQQANQM